MKAKKKTKRAQPKSPPVKPISIKVGEAWSKAVIKKALRFSRGNVSAWVRHASRMYVPKKNERIPLKAS